MFNFPYNYNNKFIIHEKIYGEYDVYYYIMRILRDYLAKLETYQGIYRVDFDNKENYNNLILHIKDRIVYTKCELPNDNIVYKIIRSINKEHFLKFIKTFCKNKNIPYTSNLNMIDIRELLAHSCCELINIYKSEIIEGWEGNTWAKVHNRECYIYGF